MVGKCVTSNGHISPKSNKNNLPSCEINQALKMREQEEEKPLRTTITPTQRKRYISMDGGKYKSYGASKAIN